jgi:hypothetical protein
MEHVTDIEKGYIRAALIAPENLSGIYCKLPELRRTSLDYQSTRQSKILILGCEGGMEGEVTVLKHTCDGETVSEKGRDAVQAKPEIQ